MILCFGFHSFCFAAEWKSLHEKADGLSLNQALDGLKQGDSADNLYVLGLVYLNQHQDKDAKAIFLKVNDPVRGKWAAAEIARREHRLNQAEKGCQEVIIRQPDFYPAYITLAFIKYLRLDFPQAARLAAKVIAQGKDKVDLSNYTRAYSILAGANGMIAHYGGPFSKAINGTQVLSNLRKAQKLQPDSAGVLFGLGSYHLLAPVFLGRDINKAEYYLKKAIQADPGFADAYVRLAQVYKAKKDMKGYESNLAEALQVDPGNELALDIKNGKCAFICN